MTHSKVKVTTTSSFDGVEIIEYLEPVTSHVIVGMNIFRDIFAGFTDIFGGNSTAYHKILTSINERAIDELKRKAHAMGGNCVLGLKIDNDEISGSGKSMMMINAIGTVAIAKFDEQKINSITADRRVVELEELEVLRKEMDLLSKIETYPNSLPSGLWQYLDENHSAQLVGIILDKYIHSKPHEMYFENDFYAEKLPKYLNRFDPAEISEILTSLVMNMKPESNYTRMYRLFFEYGALDFSLAEYLMKSEDLKNAEFGLRLLTLSKKEYTSSDIDALESLLAKLPIFFPDRSKVIEKSKMLSSKTVEMWVCSCGTENVMSNLGCYTCHKDRRGLNPDLASLTTVTQKLDSDLKLLRTAFKAD